MMNPTTDMPLLTFVMLTGLIVFAVGMTFWVIGIRRKRRDRV
jgi:hypothetical protein